MKTYVPSPPPRQPRYGLVSSLGGEAAIRQFMQDNPSEGGPDRWEEGFEFTPLDCSSATDPFDIACGEVASFTGSSVPDSVAIMPFGIWDEVNCSTIGSTEGEILDRAKSKLATSTSHKIEAELWTGAFAQASSYDNQYLAKAADATTLAGGAATPLANALAELQQALGDCAQGSRGMIHSTTRVAGLWLAIGALRKEGGLLLDAFDNIIVAGSGYDGTSPAGAAGEWAYATTMVTVRLGPVLTSPYVDWANNINRGIAYRAAAVAWDGCCLEAINVDTATLIG